MKKLSIVLLALLVGTLYGQNSKAPTTLKGVLLEQLRTTHNQKDWFVDLDTAVSGLTPEQASWRDSHGNHSVGQLVYHLAYWNREELAKFEGKTPEKFSGNNNDTFDKYDPKQWEATVQQFNQVMADWEKAVESADDQTLAKWASGIAHVGAHNAYHIGEIVFVRKEQGSWDPEKGVK